ncbi:MAG TPA: sulfite exporter TauE/SafE family protein [Bacteroidia bacterium]|nr:sulfite exporter TauE/SafE family protein [Bacteroidia bacterium]HRH09528.1 sulfite exporter TauE/SafE family protein [Bacteroidia bacterium]
MEIALISAVAFITAILTFFSGFGLGTILTPVFMIYFPVDLAIALTGIVHFLNNLFKLALVGKGANKNVLVRFGIPAIIASFAGAWILVHITEVEPLFSYDAFGKHIQVFPAKFIVSMLLLLFALLDLFPILSKLQFENKHMAFGGILSGFFGGLSGNQGALRSAFLIRSGLSKESFVATTVVLSCFVDFTRLSVYASRISLSEVSSNLTVIVCASLAAFSGAFIGNKLLKKVTIQFVQTTVAIMLILLSLALGAGLI